MAAEHFDVVIVGAGISGIGAGYHLQDQCPDRSYVILENRPNLGGTWDLFRYPGIRSDSDMYTLGFSFKPWTNAKAIADGPAILKYLHETAREFGIDKKIRFRHKVTAAHWSTADARWTVDAERYSPDGHAEPVHFTCNFLFMCSGYYNYDQGYTPHFADQEKFTGRIVHPQKWTQDVDYTNKHVIVIGSGATAVTLVPELAKEATHVTMLQRSPTYVMARPSEDGFANLMRKILPSKIAYAITRWKNVLMTMVFFNLCRKYPTWAKNYIQKMAREQLGPDYDLKTHFTPRYNPWEQRLCIVPDNDMFEAIKAGKASVVTDTIERFTEKGILLASGKELQADLIVTATGLNLLMIGGVKLTLDGAAVDLAKSLNYKGMMYSDIPNLATSFGYTNASWTLKADLIAQHVCRILNEMKKTGMRQATARVADPNMELAPWIDLSSGYFMRSKDVIPQQGTKKPWRVYQNYLADLMLLKYSGLKDGALQFTNPHVERAATVREKQLVS